VIGAAAALLELRRLLGLGFIGLTIGSRHFY
jgi:hypothetical protein